MARAKIEYTVCCSGDLVEMEAEVIKLSEQGYRCKGGVAVVHYGDDANGFYQAMVRESDYISLLDQKCPGCDESLRGGRTIQASDGVWVHYMTGCYEDYENKLKASQSAKPRV